MTYLNKLYFFRFLFVCLNLTLFSCNKVTQDDYSDNRPTLHENAIYVDVNLGDGFVINPVSGDTILPLLNSYGDPIITGKEIPAVGRTIDPSTVEKPTKRKAGLPNMFPSHYNVHAVSKEPRVIKVNHDALITFSTGKSGNLGSFNSGNFSFTIIPAPRITFQISFTVAIR